VAVISPVDTTLRTIDAGISEAASIAASIPGAGQVVAGILEVGGMLLNAIGIRSGADEADVITKVQTPLGNQLIAINAAIPYASVNQLQTMYSAVAQLGAEFRQFVAQAIFTDGRASTQALNTIMPLIDGTGDYTSKNSQPGCGHCGPAGGGEDGIEGSIQRQIAKLGGIMIMAPPGVSQGALSSFYPALSSPSDQYGEIIPQAGTLPLYPATASTAALPATVDTGFFNAGNMPLIVGAALLFLFLRKRG
jgi:hypothetical protein